MNHVEKIKKLLRLARDGAASPAEAAVALERAMDLMARHNIEVSELDLDAETERFVTERVRVGARLSEAKYLIGNLVMTYFPVRLTIFSKYGFKRGRLVPEKELAFMGTEQDVAIAIYVFDFLVGASSRAMSAYVAGEKKARRRATPRKKAGFLQGWVYGVASRLKRPEATAALGEGKAIILKRRETALAAYAREQFPNAGEIDREKKKTNDDALTAGWIEGRKTTVRTPVTGCEQLRLE
jgi:hypothetical protein